MLEAKIINNTLTGMIYKMTTITKKTDAEIVQYEWDGMLYYYSGMLPFPSEDEWPLTPSTPAKDFADYWTQRGEYVWDSANECENPKKALAMFYNKLLEHYDLVYKPRPVPFSKPGIKQ